MYQSPRTAAPPARSKPQQRLPQRFAAWTKNIGPRLRRWAEEVGTMPPTEIPAAEETPEPEQETPEPEQDTPTEAAAAQDAIASLMATHKGLPALGWLYFEDAASAYIKSDTVGADDGRDSDELRAEIVARYAEALGSEVSQEQIYGDLTCLTAEGVVKGVTVKVCTYVVAGFAATAEQWRKEDAARPDTQAIAIQVDNEPDPTLEDDDPPPEAAKLQETA